MEENNAPQTGQPQASSKNKTIAIIIAIIAVVAIVIVVMARQNGANSEENAGLAGGTSEETVLETSPTPTETPAAADERSVRTIEVGASNFKFTPTEIRVKQGETVKIVFKNESGTHDWVLDGLDNPRTPVIQGGNTAEVQFVAATAGEYEYYCSVGQHRQMGMKGKLIVEEIK